MTLKTFKDWLAEDGVAVNCVGGGNVAGLGVGPAGEPGVSPAAQKKKRKTVLRGVLSTVNLGDK